MNTQTKMHPLNNDLIIIYFVGGITSYEFKLVKDIFSKEDIPKRVIAYIL